MNCRLVSSFLSPFLPSHLFLSNQEKLRSTTQRLAICTVTFLPQGFLDRLRKGLTDRAAVSQHALPLAQVGLASVHRRQSPLVVRHLGRGYRNGMRKTLPIHHDVALDSTDLFACVIALERCCVRVLHALRVNNQDRRAGVARQSHAGRANLIFLKPAPKR